MEAERLIRGPIKLGGQESSRIVPMCTVITQITWPDFCGGVFWSTGSPYGSQYVLPGQQHLSHLTMYSSSKFILCALGNAKSCVLPSQ